MAQKLKKKGPGPLQENNKKVQLQLMQLLTEI